MFISTLSSKICLEKLQKVMITTRINILAHTDSDDADLLVCFLPPRSFHACILSKPWPTAPGWKIIFAKLDKSSKVWNFRTVGGRRAGRCHGNLLELTRGEALWTFWRRKWCKSTRTQCSPRRRKRSLWHDPSPEVCLAPPMSSTLCPAPGLEMISSLMMMTCHRPCLCHADLCHADPQ